MARSVRNHALNQPLKRRRSATAEVDSRLQNALSKVPRSDKKKLLQELNAREEMEEIERMKEREAETQKDNEREEELEAPAPEPEETIAPLVESLLDAAYSTENIILKQTSTDLKKVTKAFDAAVIVLERNTIQKACTSQAQACKTLDEELKEHVKKLQSAAHIYQKQAEHLWLEIQEAGETQAEEVSDVKAAFADLLSNQEVELQTYHTNLKEIKASARKTVQESTNPRTIQMEISAAIKACLQAGI